MPTYRTPGVYIEEISAFPRGVVPVATAVPAFIGYTERAQHQQTPLTGQPFRVASMVAFEQVFGVGPQPLFRMAEADGAPADVTAGQQGYVLTQADGSAGGRYSLYRQLRLYFANGGGACYIVSVGNYTQALSADALIQGIDALRQAPEPTLVVVPDAVLLPLDDCTRVQQAMLSHCGVDMKSRMALLDIWSGDQARNASDGDPVARFRNTLASDSLSPLRSYAAAYYPWLHTSVTSLGELSFQHIDMSDGLLPKLLKQEQGLPDTRAGWMTPDMTASYDAIEAMARPLASSSDVQALGQQLSRMSPLFNAIMAAALKHINLLAPSAAMAGVMVQVDNTRGVWKAPANESLNQVVAPAVVVNDAAQADLNAPADGKAINAIRTFPGKGVRVWGARTLDANNPECRYINVQRTLIMVEQSLLLACKAMVFEPNDARTWMAVKRQAEDFLSQMWRQGALVGSKPEHAFFVQVGLGSTMTANDILDGLMHVSVGLALMRPAEFILVSFTQQMPKS